jgi:hypothetical protein
MGCCFPFSLICCCEEDDDDVTTYSHSSIVKNAVIMLKNDLQIKNSEIKHLCFENKILKTKISKLENMYETASGRQIRIY